MVYWPAARSLWIREASWLELPPRYSRSMPNFSLKAGGSLARASGSGGPLTVTLPSFLAAARMSSQLPAAEAGAAALPGGLAEAPAAAEGLAAVVEPAELAGAA